MNAKVNTVTEFRLKSSPIWPDVQNVLREYITCIDNLPIYHLNNAQCYWPRERDVLSILDFDLAPPGTTLKFDRDPVTGELGKMHEVLVASAGKNARNSMSMTRAPGPVTDDIRGNTSNIPFWPGGFDEPEMINHSSIEDIDFENNLRTLAKGFSSGLEFKSDNYTPKRGTIQEDYVSEPEKNEIEKIPDKINLMEIVNDERNVLDIWSPAEEIKTEQKTAKSSDIQESSFDEVIPLLDKLDIPILKISETPGKNTKSEWAEQVDVSVPLTDFNKRIPDPALSFPYELDTFQKQAILKLEENCNVFVAAHTSAGKTTVAEYAVALSQKHMTRVIYTSPIKALSNQKYREFKKKFESVGLLTGDLQINSNASCLIMTTEILQSMLYCASDVLRDLEFVIFDEVHYINNDERGHVWEESVILLPKTVNIVMLSATVPNPLIFADWVGRTKKKKMYVISTLKRPVPLQHYLYTGTDGNTKNERFLVLDESGKFSLDGWYAATKAKDTNKNNSKNVTNFKNKKMTPKQEQVLWNAFVSHLKSNNMLPVVVFMLSRKRCDMISVLLRNIDLTTETEKHTIRTFFQNNIRHLKGTDRQLPQVLMMQELLQNGVGIHHSGILPILKEIVEMLFQSGVVKLLFATETFSMGVNMPARTVVFDSITKFDGNSFRILYPTEYIQMAGRAGRRGHDTAGMVIVLCRTSVPHFNELNTMMCGQAQNLVSKFKVTYSMVLNLRRVNESVTVEAMMRRSFKESSLVLKHNTIKAELEKVVDELLKLPDLTDLQKKLCKFYQHAIDYLEYLRYLKPILYETQKKAVKTLIPGRILLISYSNHYNKLALMLSTVQSKSGRQYRVLVLNSEKLKSTEDNPWEAVKFKNSEKWHDMVALTIKETFVPVGNADGEVLIISAWHILEITSCQIKIDYNLVLANWEKRQISRFRDEAPSATFSSAVQQLVTLSLNAARDPSILQPYTKIKFDYDNTLFKLRSAVYNMKCIEISNFQEQFEIVFERSELESKKMKLQLQLSDEGLSLYPDYTNAVALLKTLGYIDDDERVALKGRVALKMGSNELLITELILKNVLTVLQPAEIAALLSTLIFQQRTDVEPKLTPELKKGCEVIQKIYAELECLEQHYQLATLQQLNFGLVEVVYDWAQAKSFAEIMEKTDVQEGIIVRCIQQLSETLRDVKNAAITIGDPVLKEKMEEASTAIKRDIVFTASLYTQD
ncbi:SKI2 subunit of superkiller complex protein [Hylaeus volcanicus]|uniref:SKI2 subunit of superkiller complex protein n=1 Tax=Hylaeus volcanicus TaxID=313075 RepID=UPI0023B7FB66|nr:SKI2 subunit of superkiller complex protein [Hylaeus volcanicus]